MNFYVLFNYIDMLGALNLILILIIIAVIMINIILTQKRLSAIEQTVASRNFFDLAEFGKLDKEFKKNYQTYFVNGIMPHVMDDTNAFIKANNINETIKENKDALNKAIDALPYTMRTNSSDETTTTKGTTSNNSSTTKEKTSNDSSTTKEQTKNAEPVVKEKFASYHSW